MQNNKLEKLSPEKHLEKYNKLYPGVFETIDDLRLNRKKLGDWPNWCFCPIAGTHAAVTKYLEKIKEPHLLQQVAVDFCNIAALAGWRKTKGLYMFHEITLAELCRTEITGDIPGEVLKFLPEWVTYVQLPRGVFDRIIGFFAYLEFDVNTKGEELRIVLDIEGAIHGVENGLACLTIHLGGSLIEGLEKTIKTGLEIAKKEMGIDLLEANYQAAVPKHLPALINLILYICSQNSEIRDTSNKPTLPKNPKPQKGGKVFNASEVKRWEVGYRLGAALREARERQKESSNQIVKTHASPKPHIRKSHWHKFYVGSKPDQKAILKWLPPIAVNVTESNENIATIRNVD